jgi:hypothetical protein
MSYIILLIIFFTLLVLYQKYLEKKGRNIENIDYYFIDITQYILNDSCLADNRKPILWIHVPYEYNTRKWLSFGSRSSTDLNQPYLYLTVKSIIKYCSDSFKIVIIDDNSFVKLIPNWNINMSMLSVPVLKNVRQLGLANLIYNYGGMCVPISFLCRKNLKQLYDKGTRDNKMFICENVDNNITSTRKMFYPDSRFIGANKNNNEIEEYINKIEQVIKNDYTSQSVFLGVLDRWCNTKLLENRINLIKGYDVGTRTIDNEAVTIDELLSQNFIKFYENMYGIWIPNEEILKRRKYEWFARMSSVQIMDGNFILAKYIKNSIMKRSSLIEPLTSKKDWIGFWQVPISTTLPIFGPMPQNLGNDVPKYKFE